MDNKPIDLFKDSIHTHHYGNSGLGDYIIERIEKGQNISIYLIGLCVAAMPKCNLYWVGQAHYAYMDSSIEKVVRY